jgi:DNA-binding response OmpR family regulator
VLLTAKAREADVQDGLAAGADDYIVKPFSPRALLSRIEALLAQRRREGD